MPTVPEPRLLGFGASTMQGVGDSQGGFLGRLAGLLAAAGTPHQCCNHGVGGNTTRDMLKRLDAARAQLPAQVVVILGCNDVPRERDAWPQNRTSLDEYAANLEAIFAGLAGAGAIFATSFAVCPRRTGVQPADLATYLDRAMGLAHTHGFTCWDLYRESLTWGDRHWAPDGMHYADAGHDLIARRMLALIQAR